MTKLLTLFVIIRLIMAFLSWGYFVPDETWQSVEVAHRMVFGQGYMTWEWTDKAIRSYVHPGFFAVGFYALKIFNLDTASTVVLLPKIMQAILSVIGDLCIVSLFKNLFKPNPIQLKTFVTVYATNWFMLYCSSRTLVNTFEMALTSIALKLLVVDRSSLYVGIISLSFVVRPTTAIFWIPLVIFDLIKIFKSGQIVTKFLGQMAPLALATLGASIAIDSYFYNRLTFVPWNFLNVNLIKDVSSQYGLSPFHFYLTNLMPALFLVVGFYPLAIGFYDSYRTRNNNSKIILVASCFWTILVYSSIGHKEHRFLLPIVPLLLCYLGHGFNVLKTRKTFVIAFGLINLGLAGYLSLVHQTGVTSVMSHLSSTLSKNPSDASILFLMRCHSTPFYSHLHLPKVKMRFLECPPNFTDNEVIDEQDSFYQDPKKWLEEQYPNPNLPTRIVCYDDLVPRIKDNFLDLNKYVKCGDFFHTHLPEGRVGRRVFVFCKN